MAKHPQRRTLTRRQERRINQDIDHLNKTGEVTELLAKAVAKYEWVSRKAFPVLYPEPQYEWSTNGVVDLMKYGVGWFKAAE